MFLKRIFYGIAYFIVLIFEITKACFDVILRMISGDIEPVVVEIYTDLKRPISQTLLANSITLTPGTVTLDLDTENKKLTVAALTPRERSDIIPFEKYILGMLEDSY